MTWTDIVNKTDRLYKRFKALREKYSLGVYNDDNTVAWELKVENSKSPDEIVSKILAIDVAENFSDVMYDKKHNVVIILDSKATEIEDYLCLTIDPSSSIELYTDDGWVSPNPCSRDFSPEPPKVSTEVFNVWKSSVMSELNEIEDYLNKIENALSEIENLLS